MQNHKFTIIIPHKNIPTLLRRCLDSIPHRDDVQIIVVDDNSDAGKVDFTQFPGLNEKNTEVYLTKEGKGAGYARNVGLSHAKGEWILFADADDMFLPEIEKVFEYCEGSDAELIYFGTSAKNSETMEPSSEIEHEWVLFKECLEKDISKLKYKIPHPWGKAVKSSFLKQHDIWFEEVPCSNDTRFSAYCDYYAQKIEICLVNSYCYMIRPDSLWHDRNKEWAKTRFEVMLRIAKFMQERKDNEGEKKFVNFANTYLANIQEYSKISYLKNTLKFIRDVGLFTYLKPRIEFRINKYLKK